MRVLPQMRGSKVHVAELNIEYMPYFDDVKDYTGPVDRLHELGSRTRETSDLGTPSSN